MCSTAQQSQHFLRASFLPSFRQTQLPGSRLRASTFIFAPHTFNPQPCPAHKFTSTWDMYVQLYSCTEKHTYQILAPCAFQFLLISRVRIKIQVQVLTPGCFSQFPVGWFLLKSCSRHPGCALATIHLPLVFPPWKIIYCSPAPLIPPKTSHQVYMTLLFSSWTSSHHVIAEEIFDPAFSKSLEFSPVIPSLLS